MLDSLDKTSVLYYTDEELAMIARWYIFDGPPSLRDDDRDATDNFRTLMNRIVEERKKRASVRNILMNAWFSNRKKADLFEAIREALSAIDGREWKDKR